MMKVFYKQKIPSGISSINEVPVTNCENYNVYKRRDSNKCSIEPEQFAVVIRFNEDEKTVANVKRHDKVPVCCCLQPDESNTLTQGQEDVVASVWQSQIAEERQRITQHKLPVSG
jgi:hypothetical protein